MQASQVHVAVILVAGKGTRVMPLTFHQPKAMIGIVDRPIIHYIVEEILDAGVREIVIVASPEQSVFKKYVAHVQQSGEWQQVIFHFVSQPKPAGNADALYRAKKYIANRPFILCFGDDLLYPLPLKKMVQLFSKIQAPILSLEKVPWKEVSRYGVVAATKTKDKILSKINSLIEKPPRNEAPSNLTIVGRYVLTPAILAEIKKLYPHQKAGKELLLTDAFVNYLAQGGVMYGSEHASERFDCGSKIGIMQAQVFFGRAHVLFGKAFKKFLRK